MWESCFLLVQFGWTSRSQGNARYPARRISALFLQNQAAPGRRGKGLHGIRIAMCARTVFAYTLTMGWVAPHFPHLDMYLSIKKLDQLPYYREELEKIPEIDPTWSNFIVMEKNPSPDSLFIINIFKNQSFKLVTKKLASYDNFYYMYHKKTKDKSD